MREIKIADSAGFCFGVEKAVSRVYEEIEKNKGKVYTLGPIIHNEEVVKDLNKKGVEVIKGDISGIKDDGVLVIRSHGISKEEYKKCEKTGLEIVDATCPYVKKIHRIVEKKSKEGFRVIIIGNPKHPEVAGIKGWGDDRTVAVENFAEFEKLEIKKDEKICIVAQTTYNHNKFKEIVEKISILGYDLYCFNTICNATHERQTEAKKIAANVDAMLVIGDKSSSNTAKLVEICEKECKNTIFIQTVKDLNSNDLSFAKSIGITAGASTPKHIIEEVQNNVRS